MCLTGLMNGEVRVVHFERMVAAPVSLIFELVADPSNQPRWDGNHNLSAAEPGQRVTAVGDVFTMTNQGDRVRENHIVEFEEGRLIAWMPSLPGGDPFGQVWRWEFEATDGGTRVTHSYDWTRLVDPSRLERARNTTADTLRASVDRLAALAEGEAAQG